ncbi:MAG: hypothetical protein AB1611_15130, partial [bacterium]
WHDNHSFQTFFDTSSLVPRIFYHVRTSFCFLCGRVFMATCTKRAKEAKKKLIEILGKDTECLQLIDKSKKVGDESELLELYETCIKRGLKELPASQRRYIQEGFYQPSEKGRKAYIETILSRLPHKQAA